MFDIPLLKCPICERALPETDFVKSTRLESAWDGVCRRCAKTESLRRWRIRNNETAAFKRSVYWQACLDYFHQSCAICGRQGNTDYRIVADHWIPFVKGGQTTATNIVPLCHGVGGCNSQKNSQYPDKWLLKSFPEEQVIQILKRIDNYFEWVRRNIMFDQFTHTQSFADAIKAIVYESKTAPDQRKAALKTINDFERCAWQPAVMQQCAEFLNVTGFQLNTEGRLTYTSPDQPAAQVALVIEVLLTRYMEALDGIVSPVYSTKEAAVYLGVGIPTIKKYVHNRESLPAIKRGHALIFTREMLDAFDKPGWGRPKQVQSN